MLFESKAEMLLTVPDQIEKIENFYLTGNEYVSLPYIDQGGSIDSINILHLAHRGLLEFSGSKNSPLLSPLLEIKDQMVELTGKLTWRYHLDWLPTFTLSLDNSWTLEGEIVAPPGFRGFYYRLCLKNESSESFFARLGWQGTWASFNYILFSKREIEARLSINYDRWTRSLILEPSSGLPLAALAMATVPEAKWHYREKDNQYNAIHELYLEPGESYETLLYAAVNLESDGAGTTAVDLRRRGDAALKVKTCDWLKSRRSETNDTDLAALLNRNLFFCYFYALGRSIDSDELVPVTSRSPRYYVSAAFWSRDSLLWSFPAIMIADLLTARELLLTVFSRHIKNAGEHAHYINGNVLYPGFELDQLAAYFLALEHYYRCSEDSNFFQERLIQTGLTTLVEKAIAQFDPESGLYSTFLDPSDDPVLYPFLTYSNALLQCAFSFLANLQAKEYWYHDIDFAVLASELEQAIYEHCTVKGPFGMMFAWTVDGKGRFSLYDNPPGSLQLLAHYGFCPIEDTVFLNTVRWIRSSNNKYFHQGSSFEEAGSLHSANPWPLGACNDLLACNAGSADFISRSEMDSGFFCETVDPDSGRVSTGAAFASAAGFFAYALKNRHQKSDVKTQDDN